MTPRPIAPLVLLLTGACGGPSQAPAPDWIAAAYFPDVAVAQPPFETVEVNWKQRQRQPYVYIEHVGHYGGTGARIVELLTAATAQGAPLDGPPFALFLDDPGQVPAAELRSRICLGIDAAFQPRPPLLVDEVRSESVVYAAVGGAYPQVPLAYPALFEYLRAHNWVQSGPVRELYLVSPNGTPVEELVTEVQIPWLPGG